MKRYVSMFLIVCSVALCLCGCQKGELSSTTTYPPIEYRAYYPYDETLKQYRTIGEIVSKADYVLLGTVIDISFEAYPYRPDAPDSGYGIQTIYTIKASQYFQGNSDETVTLVVPHGIRENGIYQLPDYLAEEQRKLAWDYGITYIAYEYPFPLTLELGETYALLLCEGEDGRMVNAVRTQYAFNVSNMQDIDQTYLPSYEDFKKYFDITD